jgi:hypothetical protein
VRDEGGIRETNPGKTLDTHSRVGKFQNALREKY